MIEGKKVFISGGAGFIGSLLAERLVEKNEIIIFDNLSRNSLKDKAISNHSNVSLIQGDVEDLEAVKKAMAGANYVVHCAGIAGIETVTKRPTKTLSVNVLGSFNVLQAATELPDCQRVVCFSTSEIFGPEAVSSKESDNAVIGAVGKPRWTYAVGKLAEEHLAYAYYSEFGLPTTVVRPFNVYGPGQVGEGAIRNFLIKAIKNEPLVVYGDGSQVRAWCYVEDMVRGTLAVMSHPAAVGDTFNIGNVRSVGTIHDLAKLIIEFTGSQSSIEYHPPLSAEIEFRTPSVDKAREVLGFEAETDLRQGLEATVNWYKSII